MFKRSKIAARFALAAIFVFASAQAAAGGKASYHVTITNLTRAIVFTPILVASHRRPLAIFEAGTPAGDDLRAIAEAGDIGPLTTTLNAERDVVDLQSSGGPLGPGDSVSVILNGERGAKYISIASMMLPTNDGFIGLNSARVWKRGSVTYFSPGYDAGSEANDESCANIPGPICGGVGFSPGDNVGDEGYVHIHRGTHGIGDLDAALYDWRNPVARIVIRRVHGSD
jgi:hypothetical protein